MTLIKRCTAMISWKIGQLMIALLLSTNFGITSCTEREELLIESAGIVGTWELIEVLNDPGDGSGTFQTTDIEKTLRFRDDGTVASTTAFCSSQESGEKVFVATYHSEDMIILSECRFVFPISYELMGGNILILNLPCIEPCREKYRRLQIGN